MNKHIHEKRTILKGHISSSNFQASIFLGDMLVFRGVNNYSSRKMDPQVILYWNQSCEICDTKHTILLEDV